MVSVCLFTVCTHHTLKLPTITTHHVGGIERALQLELLVEANPFRLLHFLLREGHHKLDCRVRVVFLVVTGGGKSGRKRWKERRWTRKKRKEKRREKEEEEEGKEKEGDSEGREGGRGGRRWQRDKRRGKREIREEREG